MRSRDAPSLEEGHYLPGCHSVSNGPSLGGLIALGQTVQQDGEVLPLVLGLRGWHSANRGGLQPLGGGGEACTMSSILRMGLSLGLTMVPLVCSSRTVPLTCDYWRVTSGTRTPASTHLNPPPCLPSA